MEDTKDLKELFKQYATMVVQKSMVQAIDMFYHPDIKQYENDQDPLEGKDFLRAKEIAVGKNMKSLDLIIKEVKIDQDKGIVKGRMLFNFESVELGKRLLDEQFTQVWKDGLIIEQRFRY